MGGAAGSLSTGSLSTGSDGAGTDVGSEADSIGAVASAATVVSSTESFGAVASGGEPPDEHATAAPARDKRRAAERERRRTNEP
jgi:hypothetical protein